MMCSDGTRESRERVGTSIRPRICVDRRCRPETVPVAGSVAPYPVTIAHARAHALPPPTAAPASRSIPCSYLAFPGALHRACAPAAAARPRASRDYQKRQVLRWRLCHDPACIHASRIDRALSVRPVPSPFGGRGVRAIVLLLDERVEEHAANANGASEQLNGLQRLA